MAYSTGPWTSGEILAELAPSLPQIRPMLRLYSPWLGLALSLLLTVPGSLPGHQAVLSVPAPPLATTAPAAAPGFPPDWPWQPVEQPPFGRGGAVSSTDSYATEVGRQVLADGGTAVDAAIAVAFALAVVNPEAGNLGGGGFMILRTADGTSHALDFREKAPLAAHRDMYLDAEGLLTDDSLIGHRAAGVPGTVMGLAEAHQRFGTLPWRDLVQPAVTLAEGIVLHRRLADSLRNYHEKLNRFETTRHARASHTLTLVYGPTRRAGPARHLTTCKCCP